MSDVTTPETVSPANAPRARRTVAIQRRYAALLLLLMSLLVLVGYLAAPFLLWSYNLDRAGRLLEQGLSWPEPRLAADLPQTEQPEALDEALGHLAAAMRWRPDHYHSYRMAAHAYMAQREWPQAAQALEQARVRKPENPMLVWEAGLVYEQLALALHRAPRAAITDQVASGAVEAPSSAVDTPVCVRGDAQSCYAGLRTFVLPVGPDGPPVTSPVLFVHPPVKVRHTLSLPEESPAISFMLGLDPAAAEWGSDGATFQLWVEQEGKPSTMAFERSLTGDDARGGWLPDWADLSAWAGEEITLVFGVQSGPAGNAQGDWYGWGDITVTSIEGARSAVLAPEAKMAEAWEWLAGRIAPFESYAQEAQDPERATAWLVRDAYRADISFETLFERMIAALEARHPLASSLVDQVLARGGDLTIYDLEEDESRIPGGELRWAILLPAESVSYTTTLAYRSSDPEVGQMWWTGSAIAVVSVAEEGQFDLSASVQHDVLPPVRMSISVDGQVVHDLALDRGDGSWETVRAPVSLGPGLHVVEVSFLNDAAEGGLDRDAAIEWLEFTRIQAEP